MIYLASLAILFILMILYFKIADKYNIIDKPNERSSHSEITIRGGGIIFPAALLLFTLIANGALNFQIAGILLISFISFWDDVRNLPNRVRLVVHLTSVSILFFSFNVFALLPFWATILAYILIIGTVNAYNFMDGINGITGIYSLVTLSSLYFINRYIQFSDSDFIVFPIIACVVFLFYNFRKKAKCFAGDVGSVTIGFWIITLLLSVIILTGDFKYMLFLAIYGVDSVLTILHRLYLKQNIFKAHRLHLYQVMANDKKISHVLIAVLYGIIQLTINIFLITTSYSFITYFLFICIPLGLFYFILKAYFNALHPVSVN